MTAYTDISCFVAGLNQMQSNADKYLVCNAQPTTYIAASSSYNIGIASLGAGNILGAPYRDDFYNGAKIDVIARTTGGLIVNTGLAAFFGVAYSTGSVLYAGNAMQNPQLTIPGSPFGIADTTIEFWGAE